MNSTTKPLVTMEIPERVIQEIISAQVSTRVIEALEGRDSIIEGLVKTALSVKVDDQGKPCNYGRGSYLDWCVSDAIRSAARKACVDYLATKAGVIEAEVQKQIKKSTSALVSSLMKAFAAAATSHWRLHVDVSAKLKEEM